MFLGMVDISISSYVFWSRPVLTHRATNFELLPVNGGRDVVVTVLPTLDFMFLQVLET